MMVYHHHIMDKATLFAGGTVSMLGMEAASYAGALLKQRRMRDDERPIVMDDYPDTDDKTIPYTVDDNKGSILCFQESVFYISNSLLSVTLLDTLNQRYFHLQPHHAVMFNKASLMKHRFDRFRAQCGIWLLHMMLSDLNTLLRLSPRKPLNALAKKFIPVIQNMTGSPVIPTTTWTDMFTGYFSRAPTARTATASRVEAMDLVIRLQASNAVNELDAAIRQSKLGKSMFFHYCGNGGTFNGPIEKAARNVCSMLHIEIVTPKDSGLRYIVTP
jgi:hypothetical protein